MKKVSLLFEKTLKFQWEQSGASRGQGGAIFGLLCHFNDLQLLIFCNPTMPENMAYGNYFHSWLRENEFHRDTLRDAAQRCHRLSARIYPVQAMDSNWVELSADFFESGARKPFTKMLMQLSENRNLDKIHVQRYD